MAWSPGLSMVLEMLAGTIDKLDLNSDMQPIWREKNARSTSLTYVYNAQFHWA